MVFDRLLVPKLKDGVVEPVKSVDAVSDGSTNASMAARRPQVASATKPAACT